MPRPERRLVLDAWCLMPIAATSVRLVRVDRASDVLSWCLGLVPAGQPVEPERAAELVTAVGALTMSRCLPRALVLRTLLAHRGTRTDLVIGAAPEGEGLRAHAWLVDADGASLPRGGVDDGYAPLYRLGASGQTSI